MPASIYTSLRSFPASGLRLLRESHAFCTILTLNRKNQLLIQGRRQRRRRGWRIADRGTLNLERLNFEL